MKKVVAVVNNSVLHDIRVIKEAESLQRNGYNVTIVGIKDNKNNFDRKRLLSGVEVRLAPWKFRMHKEAAKLATFGGVFAFAALAVFGVIIATALMYGVQSFEYSSSLGWTSLQVLMAALLPIYPCLLIYRFRRHQKKFHVNYLASENGEQKKKVNDITRIIYEKFDGLRDDEIAKIVLEEKPDILHIHDIHPIRMAKKIKAKLGCKVVYDAHEIYEELAQASKELKKKHLASQKIAETIADKFITVSDSFRDFYASNYDDMPSATVIKNATLPCELGEYDGRLHEAAGIPLSQNILLYQGGFAKQRGLNNLLDVATYLPDNWTLVMMGWGTLEDSLRKVASRIDLSLVEKANSDRLDDISSGLIGKLELELLQQIDDHKFATQESESIVVKDDEGNISDIRQMEVHDTTIDVKEAMKDIGAKVKDIKGVIIHNAMKNIVSKIVFIPPAPQSELRQWTQGATLGIIPYENVGLNHYYCSPNKIWEYPAAGIPFIASPFPELTKVIEEHGIGWLAQDPFDPRQTANFIANLSVKEIAEKEAACHAFSKKDNWSVYEQRLLALYQDL